MEKTLPNNREQHACFMSICTSSLIPIQYLLLDCTVLMANKHGQTVMHKLELNCLLTYLQRMKILIFFISFYYKIRQMEHHKQLKRLWDEGMTNYGTVEGKRHVALAVEKTGCTAKQVKVISLLMITT